MTDYRQTAGTGSDFARDLASDDVRTSLLHKVAWGSIFAGVTIGLIVQVMLTMLGVGLGVATLDPIAAQSPEASSMSIGAGIWFAIAGLISAFAGGYVASRMSGKTDATTGALHGLTAWALTTLIVVYLLSTAAGAIIGGAFSGVASAVGGIGQTVAQTAAPALANSNPLDAIEQQVRASGTDPEALQANATNAIRALLTGDEAGAAEARQQAAQALANARGIPVEQAQQQVAEIERQYRETVEQAERTARETADAAASAVSTGAIFAFIGLVLGAIAGWIGGRSGVVHPVYADRLVPSRRVVR